MNKKVSTDSYKGVRDFYPEDWRFQKWLFWKMTEVVEKFGYENYTASPLEYTALFEAKSGREIVEKETYNLTDRGGREVTLRPEMTPTIARMIAAKNREIPRPIRWYSIPNVFRYEKPQRGRLREHYQLNVDFFGIDGIEAEIEMIEIGAGIMKNIGAKDNDFEIRLNDRRISKYIFSTAILAGDFTSNKEDVEKKIHQLSKIYDKKNKLSEKEFEEQIKEVVNNRSFLSLKQIDKLTDIDGYKKGVVEKIKKTIIVDNPKDIEVEIEKAVNPQYLGNIILDSFKEGINKYHKELFLEMDKVDKTENQIYFFNLINEYLNDFNNAIDEIRNIKKTLENKNINNVIFDITLMRGFDYYTGIVFEFFDTHPDNNRSLFGGGRYDDLLDIFGQEKIPAIGFGMGDVTAKDFLEIRGILPEEKSKTDLAVLVLEKEFYESASKLVDDLRNNNIKIDFDFSYRKLEKQIKAVEKKGIENILIFGERENNENSFSVKNIETGEKEENLDLEKIIEILKK